MDTFIQGELSKLIRLNKPLLLRTEKQFFQEDSIEILSFLTKNYNLIIVNYDLKSILIQLKQKTSNLKKIQIINAPLIDSFQELELMIYKNIEEIKNNIVIVIALPEKIEKSFDETSIFFNGFSKSKDSELYARVMKKFGVK